MSETLSLEEFERLLSRGRGKAILHLQQHDAAPYREVIRRCCLTNTAYDPQIEGTRETYLMQVIELLGESDALCEAAIQALHRETAYTHDFDRLFELLGQFARKGYQIARQALYAWCRVHYNPQASQSAALFPLLELDGLQAFFFLLDPRQSGHWFDMNGDDYDDFEDFLDILESKLGKDATWRAFQAATQDRPALCDAIQTIYARRQAQHEERMRRRAEPREKDWTDLPYSELRDQIDTNMIPITMSPFRFGQWGKKASDEDLYSAAVDFIILNLPPRDLLNYAAMFQHRTFPLDDFSRLFNLACHTNLSVEPFPLDRSTICGLNALENISHPEVRAFALEMLANHMSMGQVVEILANNFEAGDWARIESLFDHIVLEPDYHDLGFSIKKVFEKHPSLDAVSTLIRMFDANPCSHCRMDTVESLVSLNALPDWIAEECFYDANLDLRAYAERGFTHASDD